MSRIRILDDEEWDDLLDEQVDEMKQNHKRYRQQELGNGERKKTKRRVDKHTLPEDQ